MLASQIVRYGRPEQDANALEASPHAAVPMHVWARRALMHRVSALDVHACPRCSGRLRVIATAQDPLVAQAILAHLRRSGAPSRLALPTRLGRNRVDSSIDQAFEASLSPPPPAP